MKRLLLLGCFMLIYTNVFSYTGGANNPVLNPVEENIDANQKGFIDAGDISCDTFIATTSAIVEQYNVGDQFDGGAANSTTIQSGVDTLQTDVAVSTTATAYRIKASSNDTTGNYLDNKLIAGVGIEISTENAFGNEYLKIGAIGGQAETNYFGTGNISDIAGYYIMTTSQGAITTTTITVTGITDGVCVGTFTTLPGYPGVTSINGISDMYLWANKSGNKSVRVYSTVSIRHSDGTEVLIATSDNSGLITATISSFDFRAIITSTQILTTDRIIGRIYAVVGSGASTDLMIYFENEYDSYMSLPVGGTVRHSQMLELSLSESGHTYDTAGGFMSYDLGVSSYELTIAATAQNDADIAQNESDIAANKSAITSSFTACSQFRQVFFGGGATVSTEDNAGTYEGAQIYKNEFAINSSSRPVYGVKYPSHTIETYAYWEQTMDEHFDDDKDINIYIEFYTSVTSSNVLFNVYIATMQNVQTRTWTKHQVDTTLVGGTAYDIVKATITFTGNSAGFIKGAPYGVAISRDIAVVDTLADVYLIKSILIGNKEE